MGVLIDCYHFLVIMSKADINISVQVLYGNAFSFSFGKYLGQRLLGYIVKTYLTAKVCFKVVIPFCIHSSSVREDEVCPRSLYLLLLMCLILVSLVV